MLRGWKYIKWGHCGECDDDDARLYSPILNGSRHVDETTGKEILRGAHLVSFAPICTKCSRKYDVHQLCLKCARPLRRIEGVEEVLYDCSACPTSTGLVGLTGHYP